MDKLFLVNLTDKLIPVFKFAAEISLKYREKGLIKKIKEDNTPVTDGDIEVNKILTSEIEKLTPNIPIVSEEETKNKKKDLSTFWLIDPIDGTQDYINNRDEFTLNAALIINKKPELGIINAPAKKRLFFTHGTNSYEIGKNNEFVKLNCKEKKNQENIKALTYSDNLKPEIAQLHKKFGVKEFKKMKSSLKFCVIAAGEYDLYIAEPRASEWDIAAGHAILRYAGGSISDFDGNEILYGKKDFKNPSLILKGKID
tara:strand:- start:4828 stop:5595 length:768 start_codon:yes stop_codon:yes gene_type:complete